VTEDGNHNTAVRLPVFLRIVSQPNMARWSISFFTKAQRAISRFMRKIGQKSREIVHVTFRYQKPFLYPLRLLLIPPQRTPAPLLCATAIRCTRHYRVLFCVPADHGRLFAPLGLTCLPRFLSFIPVAQTLHDTLDLRAVVVCVAPSLLRFLSSLTPPLQ